MIVMNDEQILSAGEQTREAADYTRRDFLKGGTVATMMAMLGGVPLFTEAAEPTPEPNSQPAPKVKVALIGCGTWGRELLAALGRLPTKEIWAEPVVVAICDSYASAMRRAADRAPKAAHVADYKAVLADPNVQAVIVATPTHKHKEIVLAALKAGKHVYCEAPLAHTIEDAHEIAKAARDAKQLLFQAGLQLRADKERNFLVPFIRSGAMGDIIQARAQWNKKTSWMFAAPTAAREKELNWRLDRDTSLGLIGEVGIHQLDQANWFLNAKPKAVTGFGSVQVYTQDGRQVPDTIQAIITYPSGANLVYTSTLGNSFDADYDMYYGNFAAVMVRENKAWLFKEADSPLLGWEIYSRKEKFYNEVGISLVAGASKSVQVQETVIIPPVTVNLMSALGNFLQNANDYENAKASFELAYGKDADPADLIAQLEQTKKTLRPAAGYLDAYQATVLSVKANEAVLGNKKVQLTKDMYELT
jgi:predicted dehydrogenase